jgi:hypothetical protein
MQPHVTNAEMASNAFNIKCQSIAREIDYPLWNETLSLLEYKDFLAMQKQKVIQNQQNEQNNIKYQKQMIRLYSTTVTQLFRHDMISRETLLARATEIETEMSNLMDQDLMFDCLGSESSAIQNALTESEGGSNSYLDMEATNDR